LSDQWVVEEIRWEKKLESKENKNTTEPLGYSKTVQEESL
jgi:hypothetical protein